jgi:hypothetical protein
VRTDHVERLEHLALVAGTVTVHRERRRLLVHVLLRERNAGTDGDLRADDTVSTEEGLSEDVHGAALAVGHADLASEELAQHPGDGAAAEDSERMATVSSDDGVLSCDTMLKTDRNGFLGVAERLE